LIGLAPDRFPDARPVAATVSYSYVAAAVDPASGFRLYGKDGLPLLLRCFVPLHGHRTCIEVRS
jgi:hypothetical protein